MGLCRIKATELIEDTPKLLQDSLCKRERWEIEEVGVVMKRQNNV